MTPSVANGRHEPGYDQRRQGTPMFVHDFAPVPQPVDAAVRGFGLAASGLTLAEIVKRAWNEEAPMLAALVVDRPAVRASRVAVEVTGHRLRGDAAIVNIRWYGDGWLPALDADLEIVAFGRKATHLHLMGRYELPESVDRFGPTGSLLHRVMVVVVRQFLTGPCQVSAPETSQWRGLEPYSSWVRTITVGATR